MRRRLINRVIFVETLLILITPGFFFKQSFKNLTLVHVFGGSLLSVTPIIPSTSTSSSPTSPEFNSTILAALITSIIGIVGIIITGGFLVYQTRKNAKLQRENLDLQQRYQRENMELQNRYQQELMKLQHQHDNDLLHIQKDVELKYITKEREEQLKEREAQATRIEMDRATTIKERIEVYRKALHADPRISRFQILDMSRPLEILNMYVRIRVHEQARLNYSLEHNLLLAESKHDPNAMLRAVQKSLEDRVGSSLDPDKAIRKYNRCVIVGDPGAGKTTLLKYLTLQSADRQFTDLPDLPIHIELNAFAICGHNDLLEFASSKWASDYNFPIVEARLCMEQALNDGTALLLLDALDETIIGENVTKAETSYQRVSDAIMQLATRYHQSPIVVTARKAGYQQRAPLQGFVELETLDFSAGDIKRFVDNWFQSYHNPQKAVDANELNSLLERSPRILALAANPLLLSLIVIVYEAHLDLPDRRAELYKRCIDTLLTEWDARRNIRRRREFKPENKQQLLEEIAWHFHIQGRRYFPLQELLRVIEHFLPAIGLPMEQNKQVLEEIANENGLLKEQAHGWYGFLHLTLQEYFVAQYVTDHNELKILLDHRGDPWWEEVLLLYAGQTPDASDLLQGLLEQDEKHILREDIFYTNLILAGQCLVANPTIRIASLRQTVIDQLFEILITTNYRLIFTRVTKTLVEIGGNVINERLIRLLSDKHVLKDRHLCIITEISKANDLYVVPQLHNILSDKEIDQQMRFLVALTLAKWGEKSIASYLLQLLIEQENETNLKYVNEAVTTLNEICGSTISSDLLDLISKSQAKVLIKYRVAITIGKLGEQWVVPDLLKMLTNKKIDNFVRGGVAQALGDLGDEAILPDLFNMLKDEQIFIRDRLPIAAAFADIGKKSTAIDLISLISNEQLDLQIRGQIAEVLGRSGEPRVGHILVQSLANKAVDWHLRQDISETIGNLGDSALVPQLKQLFLDKRINIDVRGRIAVALAALKEESMIPELIDLVTNKKISPGVRIDFIRVIGSLGKPSIIPDLILLLDGWGEDHEIMIQEMIASTIMQLGDDEETAIALTKHLDKPFISEWIFQALWMVSRRAGISIFITSGSEDKKQYEIEKW